MTAIQLKNLLDVIDEALDALPGEHCSIVRHYIKENHRRVFEEHEEEMADEKLDDRIRDRRKARKSPKEEWSAANLCLDFGLPKLDIDTEISVPRDMTNLIFGPVRWLPIEEATLDDLDKHIALLEAQAAANVKQAKDFRLLRGTAARFAQGRKDVTIGELREIAREGRN